jgi:Arc/MetJ-type ribon-helix-helix transcriptional regulator
MQSNARSSITLPKEELRLVEELRKRTRARSKVAVVRAALRLLDETTNRERLRQAYLEASLRVRESTREELAELDHLASEGLDG